MAVVEFARHVLNLDDANSTELNESTPHPVVIYMPEISKTHMGGTMRLGSRETIFTPGSESTTTYRLYSAPTIHERHRHRYEINPSYVPQLEVAGLKFIGRDATGERMSILELEGHPFFVATQFHPEYKTRPLKPCPVFLGFILAASGILEDHFGGNEGEIAMRRYASVVFNE